MIAVISGEPSMPRDAKAVERARTATRTALLLSGEAADGVKRKLPGWKPRRANSAASLGSATAGVKLPLINDGADAAWVTRNLVFWVDAAIAGVSNSDSAASDAPPIAMIPFRFSTLFDSRNDLHVV